MPATEASLIEIRNASLTLGDASILKKVSICVDKEEIVALVGESGSGKSITALTLLGLQPLQSKITAEKLTFDQKNILALSPKEWETIRGKEIGMVFQEPQSSLNPTLRCGKQLLEVLQKHSSLSRKAQLEKINTLLHEVQLQDTDRILKSYPHQLSGGQKQRVMIAMALLCNPKLLIADEPTTALDVTVQKEILHLLRRLQQKYKMSVLFISHDLALVKNLANRVYVMHQGKVVESGLASTLFKKPKHPYTAGLIAARPVANTRPERLLTLADFEKKTTRQPLISALQRATYHTLLYQQPPLLEIKGFEKTYIKKHWGKANESFRAVDKIDFSLYPGEVLGLVGESGCGKSSLAKSMVFLDPPTQGTLLYKGQTIDPKNQESLVRLRKDIQFIFQDPYSALHPLKTVGAAIEEVLHVHRPTVSKKEHSLQCYQLLDQVGLDTPFYHRYPHELSGGQRQRVVIARALATDPKILICDESVAALDISIQAQVLNLLNDLKDQFKLSYLFISHDLAVVKYMADRIMVMEQGRLVEIQEADALYRYPKKAYTKKLIAAIPE
ncbi:MAG: ABC transporter ATP-binding protein [Bacteroidetes bacterium]|nr:ABC transporter ATP-binding protein [Bacteroidota bacterium]MDA0922864.1 ABC transporter ATP-binding protein [Bacteroidota bacterium]MDA1289134.1 ABC transporter ATP-binding protein [Bacteroidota bacterium]